MTDYFKFKQKRVFLPLSAEAVEAKGSFKVEAPACHPHVVLEARPSFGARQFMRTVERDTLAAAGKAARATIDLDHWRDLVNEMSEDEFKSTCKRLADAANATIVHTRRDLSETMIGGKVFSSPIVQAAYANIKATKVALLTRSIGGDFTCYAEEWASTPEWPPLDSDGAVEARVAILHGLADEDMSALAAAATASLEVEEEEAKKSEPLADS